MLALNKESLLPSRPLNRAELFVRESMTREGRWGVGHFQGLHLRGAFQPIYCLSHKRPIGYEGLVRSTDAMAHPVSPSDLFGRAGSPETLVYLDRLCRAVHMHNFVEMGLEDGWLFVNLNPSLFWTFNSSATPFTVDLLDHFGLEPKRVVLEILEKYIPDEVLMGELINHYHLAGCLVAIDDFGSGHANFDRIWRFRPDIVKLDRSIIANAAHSVHARRMVPGLVSLLHQAGSIVLIEGIETKDEAMIALDAGADFVQGFYFCLPSTRLESVGHWRNDALEDLASVFRHYLYGETRRQFKEIRVHLDNLETWVDKVDSLEMLRASSLNFAKKPGVKRCFILNSLGIQVGANISVEQRPHFAHIAGGDGADWSRRTYYRRAVGRPGAIQVIGPYFSQPDASMCVTLSIAIEIEGEIWVFCTDIEWNGPADMIVGEN